MSISNSTFTDFMHQKLRKNYFKRPKKIFLAQINIASALEKILGQKSKYLSFYLEMTTRAISPNIGPSWSTSTPI